MSKQGEVRDNDDNITHIRETSDTGRESTLYEYDGSIAAHITGDHKGDAVEFSTHSEDGRTRAYEYDDSIGAHITGDHRGEEKTESGGGCYLTTACVQAHELPDNCLELMILRNFRDNFLLTDSKGKREVKEYYRIAPSIVAGINSHRNAALVWKGVYADIKHAVTLIQQRKLQETFEHYKKMTLRLKQTCIGTN